MKHLLSVAITVTLLASCAPTTPEARITAQTARFDALPPKHQELVREGRIDRGMSPDAVYFAWGTPSREYEGSDGGTATMRWDYAGLSPVYTNHFYGGFGYGRYGRYGRAYPIGYAFGPEVSYVPYRRATVLFRGGRVASWEQNRN